MQASMKAYQVCNRCVMDTSDPEIQFNQEGICNHCTNYPSIPVDEGIHAEDSPQLAALMAKVRSAGRGRKFDCVVGVSGGVDSSTVLRLACNHGLQVLAVHMDNGWNSPIAVQNIKRLVEKLDVEYASYVLPWSDFRKVQVAFLKASVPEAETPTDAAIVRALHHHALKHRVKYVLSGGNFASEGILPVTWHYNARDTKYAYSILDASDCPRRNFSTQRFGFLDEFYAKIVRGTRTCYPLNCVRYDRDAGRALLERDFGWQYYGSKHGESRFTKFIHNYYLFVKHGIDYRRATSSSEICIGKLDRDEALAQLEAPPFSGMDMEVELSYVAKKLALDRAELDRIIQAPAKWYFDYPNNKALLGRMYDVYRFLAGKEKLSNF